MDRKEFRRRLAARVNDVRFEEIDGLLRLYGWELDRFEGAILCSGVTARGSSRSRTAGREFSAVYVPKVLDATEEDDK